MRNWSHGLMFAALLSALLVVGLLFAAAGGSGIDVDVDHPKVSVTKTYNVTPPKGAPAVKVPSQKKKK